MRVTPPPEVLRGRERLARSMSAGLRRWTAALPLKNLDDASGRGVGELIAGKAEAVAQAGR